MTVEYLQKQIALLERKISQQQGDIVMMQRELDRLKLLAFEEEFVEDDNRKLLQE